jgi:PAS domain S-box-containing protein
MLSALILSQKFISSNIYPIINVRFFILSGLFSIGLILLFRIQNHFLAENKKMFSPAKLAYLAFPLIMSFATMIIIDGRHHSEILLLLPVLVTASVMGKKAGLAMSTLCSLLAVFYHVVLAGKNFFPALEYNIMLICLIYVLGWFVGGLTDIEAQHRKHLNMSLLSLEKEIDIRRKAEEELRVLSCAVEQSPSMVIITDTSGKIDYVNNSYTRITGYASGEVKGKYLRDYNGQPAGDFSRIWDTVEKGKEWIGEICNNKNNGESYWEFATFYPLRDNDGNVTHFLKFAEDISEHKQMERDMAKLDRLNLVGEMAASIGHEIRNPMTTVRGFLQMLGAKEDCSQYKEYYDLMIQELDRANSIITEYLSLARNKPVNHKMHNINNIVTTLFPLILADATNCSMQVEMKTELTPDIMVDEKEMRQLILNLVRNGLESMQSGGKLTISTYPDGDGVVLSVLDQGQGISPDILDKIGTPFFTTKENGTGLGLAVCYSIATRHNASIKVESGFEGTAFKVVFKV